MKEIETGISCFECNERSGIDCPGRRPGEATRCGICMEKFMERVQVIVDRHKKSLKKLVD